MMNNIKNKERLTTSSFNNLRNNKVDENSSVFSSIIETPTTTTTTASSLEDDEMISTLSFLDNSDGGVDGKCCDIGEGCCDKGCYSCGNGAFCGNHAGGICVSSYNGCEDGYRCKANGRCCEKVSCIECKDKTMCCIHSDGPYLTKFSFECCHHGTF